MEKVIRIKLGDKFFYHVSWNPNNGEVTTTDNIKDAAVYSTGEERFACEIIECIRQSYETI